MKWCQAAVNYNAHGKRHQDLWVGTLELWRGPEMLQQIRAPFVASNPRSERSGAFSVLGGRLDSRQLRGRPCQRYSDGLALAVQRLGEQRTR